MPPPTSEAAPAPLRYAMVGGGTGSFIGAVHRKAAALDGQAVLVAGALSSTPERSMQSAREIGLPEDRAYPSWQALLDAESKRRVGDRPDFISIVTPNDTHHPIAKGALEAGFHVVLDKPATHTSAQAAELARLADANHLLCCVTYNYTGNAMVRQAAAMIADGTIGSVRRVLVEYHQGWLATALEQTGMKQAAWRTDPARAGLGGALGDIGTHAENLLGFITGLKIESLCSDLTSFVPGRRLDDDVSVLLRLEGGAKGTLTCSQVCVGEDNNLSIRVYGDKGGLTWRQQTPERLIHAPLDGAPRTLVRGGPGLSERATHATRLPAGHPEGYLEAFANIYLGAIDAIRARRDGAEPSGLGAEIPTMREARRSVRFIELCVESATKGAPWIEWTD